MAAASTNAVSPTNEQLDMLRAVVPEEHFQLTPSISDRDYWEGIAATDSGKLYVADARSDLNFEHEVDGTDDENQ